MTPTHVARGQPRDRGVHGPRVCEIIQKDKALREWLLALVELELLDPVALLCDYREQRGLVEGIVEGTLEHVGVQGLCVFYHAVEGAIDEHAVAEHVNFRKNTPIGTKQHGDERRAFSTPRG